MPAPPLFCIVRSTFSSVRLATVHPVLIGNHDDYRILRCRGRNDRAVHDGEIGSRTGEAHPLASASEVTVRPFRSIVAAKPPNRNLSVRIFIQRQSITIGKGAERRRGKLGSIRCSHSLFTIFAPAAASESSDVTYHAPSRSMHCIFAGSTRCNVAFEATRERRPTRQLTFHALDGATEQFEGSPHLYTPLTFPRRTGVS